MKRRHRLGWLLASALLAASGSAWAQSAPSQKTLELSTQLLDLAGVKPILVQMLDQVAPSLTLLVQQANPGKESQVGEVMNQFVLPKMKERLPEVLHEGAVVYANHFSADEIAQLIQFYQSPLGKKLVHEQPLMSQEMARIGSAWAQAVAVQAIQEYSEEFRKRGLQAPI